MTHAANQSAPQQGIFRRALAAAGAFLEALDYSSFDYTIDRIAQLEGEVGRLREEVRQGRTGPAHARDEI